MLRSTTLPEVLRHNTMATHQASSVHTDRLHVSQSHVQARSAGHYHDVEDTIVLSDVGYSDSDQRCKIMRWTRVPGRDAFTTSLFSEI